MKRLSTVLALGAFALGLGVPSVARAALAANASACSGSRLPVATRLVNPVDGAIGVTTRGSHIELETFVPAVPLQGVPALGDERVVLVDNEPWATEGGILSLDASNATWPDAPAIALDGTLAAQGAITFATTWLPPLRAQTHYAVRLQPAYGPDCVYETVGSFTTGPAE